MGELKTHGDFGLGTFDGLDGEMIELDGKVFQVRADGHAHPVEDSARTPFATVSFFKADESARLDRPCDQPAMLAAVAAMLPSQNIFHALRIEGRFDYVKTRAVAKQDKSVGLEMRRAKNRSSNSTMWKALSSVSSRPITSVASTSPAIICTSSQPIAPPAATCSTAARRT